MSGRQARTARLKMRVRRVPQVGPGYYLGRVVPVFRRLSRSVHRARRKAGQL